MSGIVMDAGAPWSDGTLARAWFDETRRFRYMLERDFRVDVCATKGCGRLARVPQAMSTAGHCCVRCSMGVDFGHGGDCQMRFGSTVTFVMVNPSKADASKDDPTVARCSAFTKHWGFKRLLVVNLFALRSTDPKVLRSTPDAEGDPENLAMIGRAINQSELAVCAWGTHGVVRQRGTYIREVLMQSSHADKLRCLGTTKDGYPLHPLYQRADTELVPFGRSKCRKMTSSSQ